MANNANMALGVKRRNKILNHCSNNNILCNISVTWEAPVFSKAITRMETTYPRKPAYTLVAADNCNYLIVYMCSFDKIPLVMYIPITSCLLQSIGLNELFNQISFPHKIETGLFVGEHSKQLLTCHQGTEIAG